MEKAFRDVAAFHHKFGVPHEHTPGIREERIHLREDLCVEEFNELGDALESRDLVGVADAIGDLIYVLIGMALEFGIYLPRVWDEIHSANMAKEGGGRREDGKILKPVGWTPPDIEAALKRRSQEERDRHPISEGDREPATDLFEFPIRDSILRSHGVLVEDWREDK